MELLPTYKYLQVPFSESTVWFSFNGWDVGILDILDRHHNYLRVDQTSEEEALLTCSDERFERRTKQDN